MATAGTRALPIAGETGKEALISSEEVYRSFAHSVARWVVHLGGPGLDTEEIVQEVFAVVHERLPAFQGFAKLEPWIYRITENIVRHHRRYNRLRRWLRGTPTEAAGNLPSPEPLALERLDRSQSRELIYRVLDRMKERHRTVLILREMDGLPTRAIAELKGVALKTVWVWLHRARQEFIALFEEEERRGGR